LRASRKPSHFHETESENALPEGGAFFSIPFQSKAGGKPHEGLPPAAFKAFQAVAGGIAACRPFESSEVATTSLYTCKL
jgi:hypothetical protein